MNSVFTGFRLLLLTGLGVGAFSASAGEMAYVHSQAENARDERQLFAWEVLQEALHRTSAAYGPYSIREAHISLRQQRLLQAMDQGNRDITIALLPVMPDGNQHTSFPVRIPVIGGLWGYRVLLIAADRQERFRSVHTLDDLKTVSLGQSWYWADTEILRKAGLQVVTGESYEGLFRMLATGRFDAFSRSVMEAGAEYDAHRDLTPKLAIESRLLLHYPMPEYFWFSGDTEGRRLAQRVREGLSSMVADRSLCRMVNNRFGKILRSLALTRREVIEIPNPQLGAEDHLGEPAYWCNPLLAEAR